MGTPIARHPYMDIDPRAVFGEGGTDAFDVTNLLAFWQEWSSELSVGTDFYRQYMVQHETEMPVRWDTMEPVLEILIREGEVYAVVATFSWVRTVIEDEVSVGCYDCGEDALVVSSAWGHFLLSGEDGNNVTLGHGLALQFIRILLEMGHTATVHALNT